MNKKIIITIAATLLLKNFTIHGMETQKLTKYLEHPEEYEKFRLERSYGKIKSNFNILSKDLFNKCFRKPLAEALLIEFKHAILNHNFQEKDGGNIDALNTISLGSQELKIFRHHDGTYNLVPAQWNYAMWDESPKNQRCSRLEHQDVQYRKLLHGNRPKENDISIYCLEEEYKINNPINILINWKNTHSSNYKAPFKITHQALSYNSEWLACIYQNDDNDEGYANFFNLDSEAQISCENSKPINAFCAAHKSTLFVLCETDGVINLTTPHCETFAIKGCTDDIPTAVQFSPNDERFITYGEKKLQLHTRNEMSEYYQIETKHPISKAFFTSDGKRIIVALINGEFLFRDGYTTKGISSSHATWRSPLLPDPHYQDPLILCSTKHMLLISLDPTPTYYGCCLFFVYSLINGKHLTQYNFHPNNPRAMGLTEDERSILFIHPDEKVSLLHLFTDQDMQDFDFIEKKANIYQLCNLQELCKQFKRCNSEQDQRKDMHATALVTAVRDYIRAIAPTNLTSQ